MITPDTSASDLETPGIQYLELKRIAVASWETRQALYQRLGIGRDPAIPPSFQQRTIPSTLEAVPPIHTEIKELYESLGGTDEGLQFHLHMTLEEMLINAVKDGNQLSPEKSVTVRWGIDSNELVIYIGDEGAGFDPTKVEDRTLERLLTDTHGRGLLIVDGLSLNERYLNGHIDYLPMNEGSSQCRELVIRLPLPWKS